MITIKRAKESEKILNNGLIPINGVINIISEYIIAFFYEPEDILKCDFSYGILIRDKIYKYDKTPPILKWENYIREPFIYDELSGKLWENIIKGQSKIREVKTNPLLISIYGDRLIIKFMENRKDKRQLIKEMDELNIIFINARKFDPSKLNFRTEYYEFDVNFNRKDNSRLS